MSNVFDQYVTNGVTVTSPSASLQH